MTWARDPNHAMTWLLRACRGRDRARRPRHASVRCPPARGDAGGWASWPRCPRRACTAAVPRGCAKAERTRRAVERHREKDTATIDGALGRVSRHLGVAKACRVMQSGNRCGCKSAPLKPERNAKKCAPGCPHETPKPSCSIDSDALVSVAFSCCGAPASPRRASFHEIPGLPFWTRAT